MTIDSPSVHIDVAPTDSTEYVGSCPVASQVERSDRNYAWMPFRAYCYVFITETVEWADAASDCSRHGKRAWNIGLASSQEIPFCFRLQISLASSLLKNTSKNN